MDLNKETALHILSRVLEAISNHQTASLFAAAGVVALFVLTTGAILLRRNSEKVRRNGRELANGIMTQAGKQKNNIDEFIFWPVVIVVLGFCGFSIATFFLEAGFPSYLAALGVLIFEGGAIYFALRRHKEAEHQDDPFKLKAAMWSLIALSSFANQSHFEEFAVRVVAAAFPLIAAGLIEFRLGNVRADAAREEAEVTGQDKPDRKIPWTMLRHPVVLYWTVSEMSLNKELSTAQARDRVLADFAVKAMVAERDTVRTYGHIAEEVSTSEKVTSSGDARQARQRDKANRKIAKAHRRAEAAARRARYTSDPKMMRRIAQGIQGAAQTAEFTEKVAATPIDPPGMPRPQLGGASRGALPPASPVPDTGDAEFDEALYAWLSDAGEAPAPGGETPQKGAPPGAGELKQHGAPEGPSEAPREATRRKRTSTSTDRKRSSPPKGKQDPVSRVCDMIRNGEAVSGRVVAEMFGVSRASGNRYLNEAKARLDETASEGRQ